MRSRERNVTREREREFQTAIEACIDIAGLLIGTLDVDVPETDAERFAGLADAGVLSSDWPRCVREGKV